ncbi:MAG: aldehyde dehydrogenase family protein, partial [Nannocystaceae bacterium]|nr:aldehyde dehydrogenase family protein [Nannocystaceae bacterium]
HPSVDALCFVGGSEVGQEIMAAASRDLKRLTLELGGKSPTIVLADADIDSALDGALLSVFSSNGEVCTAGSRILVEAPLYDRFLDAFVSRTRAITVGDPHDVNTEIGPLISHLHRKHVLGMIERARQQGARVACGGSPPPERSRGCFVLPTVLHQTDVSMEIMQDEVFGPVACILRVSDADEAVSIANATRFGLAASIWSRDTSLALRLARRIRAGNIGINTTTIRDIRAPFGGVKLSGLGRLGGRWSIEQFTHVKTLSLPVEPYALPRFGANGAAST